MSRIFLMFILVLLLINISDAHWKKVYDYEMSSLLPQADLDCADSLNCISVASPGHTGSMYIKTTDGGHTWFVQFADSFKNIYNELGQWVGTEPAKFKPARCIDYVTKDFIVVGHKEGQITISRDGGITWDSINLINTTSDVRKIQFIDEYYGVVFVYSSVFKTYDGGLNWIKIDLKYKKERITYEQNMFVVGKDSLIIISYDETDSTNKFRTIFKTIDGGSTWEMGNPMPHFRYFDPYFTDMKNGWIAGNVNIGSDLRSDLIYYTSDGGETWSSQLDTLLYPELGLYGIYFYDNKEGLAYGEGGKIWRTSNSGQNWLQDSTFPFFGNDHFQKLAFPNNNTNKILANVYYKGQIWMYEDLTSVNDNELRFDNINVFPNPTSDFITIPELNNGLQPIVHKVQIFDVLGIKVGQSSLIDGNNRIDISHLPAGVYFIRIGDKVEKFVKM